jgi:hypothetical protein
MPPSVLFHDQNRLGVGCGFDLTLHNDLNRRGRSTSMWRFEAKPGKTGSYRNVKLNGTERSRSGRSFNNQQ